MRLLFVSNYFPPEVNAPATRLYEHARQWVEDGHDVEVLTSIPNFPEGQIYKGYRNRYQRDTVSGIDVMRVPMYIAENKGMLKRTLSYLSFMLSCIWFSRRIRQRPDVVVGTSPQFFAAIGAYVIAVLKRVPFVLEVRDLWPESIVAVGAVKRNALIRLFERVELFLYRKSDHIVVVTDAFKAYIEGKGIPAERITVLKNGFDLRQLNNTIDSVMLASMRREFGLEGKFVASYIGTIGMAHGVEVLMEAAQRCTDPDIVFMVVGTGAERAKLEARQSELQLPNFRLIEKQPKDRVPYLLALSDVSVVHLKASPLFKTVIPSKIFEAMAMKKPIALGVEGETKEIIEQAGSGIPFQPEDADALAETVLRLKNDSLLYRKMGENGFECVHKEYHRQTLARRYWSVLEQVAAGERVEQVAAEPAQEVSIHLETEMAA
jgi:colanic acid biosynthesis glycosyl transferase WcaI